MQMRRHDHFQFHKFVYNVKHIKSAWFICYWFCLISYEKKKQQNMCATDYFGFFSLSRSFLCVRFARRLCLHFSQFQSFRFCRLRFLCWSNCQQASSKGLEQNDWLMFMFVHSPLALPSVPIFPLNARQCVCVQCNFNTFFFSFHSLAAAIVVSSHVTHFLSKWFSHLDFAFSLNENHDCELRLRPSIHWRQPLDFSNDV